MNRWPAIALLAALLVGLALLDTRSDQTSTAAEADLSATAIGPIAAVGPGNGSTWYCPGGFSTPDATNDHLVVVSNTSEHSVAGRLTLYPSLPTTLGDSFAFDRAVQPLSIAPGEQQVLSLAPIVASLHPDLANNTGSFVAALVEVDGGGVTVEHAITTPAGRDQSACATSASSNWWFASGTTTNGVTHQIYLLNPFPEDAVVDIRFLRDDGVREPPAFGGRLIPAHSLTMLDVTPVQPVLDQFTTEITARTGRVVAERVQLFRNEAGPIGLSLTPGANALADQWFFPAGNAAPGTGESFVIFNPNDAPAEVEFELKPDSADLAGDIAPLAVPLGPNERWVVNVRAHPTHPVATVAAIDATNIANLGDRFFVSVRSFNGIPVAVERVLTRPAEVAGGVSASLGITRMATAQTIALPRWVQPGTGEAPALHHSEVAVVNPAGDTVSRVEIWAGGNGPASRRGTAELAPRRRAAFDLDVLLEPGDRWIRIISSTGTMAELVVSDAGGVAATAAVPDAGAISLPELLTFD